VRPSASHSKLNIAINWSKRTRKEQKLAVVKFASVGEQMFIGDSSHVISAAVEQEVISSNFG
jgi:hypothetical protein